MFSDAYGDIRAARDGDTPVTEHVLQCIWYDQLFRRSNLHTDGGAPITVHSPGWWNHAEGPDFRNAQIEINGRLKTGDVEIHFTHGQWAQHGHNTDSRYDDVILIVVMESAAPTVPPQTPSGVPIPNLLLPEYLDDDPGAIADRLSPDPVRFEEDSASGYCAAIAEAYGSDRIVQFLMLAGEWRLLQKAKLLETAIARAGPDQALYEAFMASCGYSRYKENFRRIARHLPYDRVRQLALQDPLLLEAALFQVAGLLPERWSGDGEPAPHYNRLQDLRAKHIPGLRKLGIEWPRVGVRPNNTAERRLAGAARVLARTAQAGLAGTLEGIWCGWMKPIERRRAFEALFPQPMGFWAAHTAWDSAPMRKPAALFGTDRVRAIIGNVFVAAALAEARMARSRIREERVFEFFAAMPSEANNRIVKRMVPRLFADIKPPRVDFRLQQGLLQVYHDWCAPNPSCRNCPVIPYLDTGLTAPRQRAAGESRRER